MSDYMFMLESHLSADQFRVVGQIQGLAATAGAGLYLTGGAMRDILGGFPVRDLDFTVEGSAMKLARSAEQKFGADDPFRRRSPQIRRVALSQRRDRRNRHGSLRAVSQIRRQAASTPATIHEDLRTRDFTVNAIALSLNKASLGLLIDPANGAGDIERKELRAIHNYSFYDDPSRCCG